MQAPLATTLSVVPVAEVVTPGLLSAMTVVAVVEDETPCWRLRVAAIGMTLLARTLATEEPAATEPVLDCISTQAVESCRAWARTPCPPGALLVTALLFALTPNCGVAPLSGVSTRMAWPKA